jgi:glycosyltransferase involved in cell wall biosynthesis
VYHGVGTDFRKTQDPDMLRIAAQHYRLPERYILFVGNIEPRKNLEGLIRAFSILKHRYPEPVKLVIAGQKGWKYGPVYRAAHELQLDNDIIFTGYISAEHLPAVYSMADIFVYPSLYEGFGLPLLEAMACEVPVIISNAGALPEIANEAALQLPANNIAVLAESMLQLLSDSGLRKQYIARGLARAKQFSWENTARETLNIYNSL